MNEPRNGIAIFSNNDYLALDVEINDWLLDNYEEVEFIDCKLSTAVLKSSVLYTIVVLYREITGEEDW